MTSLSTDERAQLIEEVTVQFWTYLIPIVRVVFAIHIFLFFLFLALNVSIMWVTNAFSIAIYLTCLSAIRRQWYQAAAMLMSIEIIAHAAIATWALGWDTNFYFSLFCVVPIIAFSFHSAPLRGMSLSLAILVITVGGFSIRGNIGLLPGINSRGIEIFGVTNALIATTLLLHSTVLAVRFTLSMQLNLFHSANRDSLTNLYTRRRVLQCLRQLNIKPNEIPISVVLLDIDHFKQINDRYGHASGDTVLQRVADTITKSVRTTDIAARWGGEEFLVLMPNTSLVEAQRVAERIMLCMREDCCLGADDGHSITATLAVATIQCGEAFIETLNRADIMLYQGKQEGRDRVMVAQ